MTDHKVKSERDFQSLDNPASSLYWWRSEGLEPLRWQAGRDGAGIRAPVLISDLWSRAWGAESPLHPPEENDPATHILDAREGPSIQPSFGGWESGYMQRSATSDEREVWSSSFMFAHALHSAHQVFRLIPIKFSRLSSNIMSLGHHLESPFIPLLD